MLSKDAAFRKDQTNGEGAVKLQHRHFAFIAHVLNGCEPDDEGHPEWTSMVKAFAEALAPTNPKFDRERFLKACGVKP